MKPVIDHLEEAKTFKRLNIDNKFNLYLFAADVKKEIEDWKEEQIRISEEQYKKDEEMLSDFISQIEDEYKRRLKIEYHSVKEMN